MTTEARASLKRNSHVVSLGPDRAAARAMLRAVGLSDDDMDKPFVAVANLASDVTPCNVHLDRLAQECQTGRVGRRFRALPVRHHYHQRRHLDGHRGHEGVAGEPRGDS